MSAYPDKKIRAEHRLEELKALSARIEECQADCAQKLKRGGPPCGKEWSTNNKQHLENWGVFLDRSLRAVRLDIWTLEQFLESHRDGRPLH